MIKPVKESVTKTYRENGVLVETIKLFHYSTEEEKLQHKEEMEKNGFTDSGQVKENVGSLSQPRYVWFGGYYKYEHEEFQ